MIVCCYWTNDTYKAMADRMMASAQKVGLKTRGYAVENASGTWQEGDCKKPSVVLNALKDNPNHSVLFVDADCRFISFPVLLHLEQHDHDMAAYFEASNFPSSTVLWFRKGRGLRYAEQWVKDMIANPNQPNDMVALAKTMKVVLPKRVLHLPPAYCWTEAILRPRFGAVVPVIEHFAVGEHKFPTFSWDKSAATIYKDDRG